MIRILFFLLGGGTSLGDASGSSTEFWSGPVENVLL